MVVSMRKLTEQIVEALGYACPAANVVKGTFDKVTVSAPALVVYLAPESFHPATTWLRQGIGYVYVIGHADATVHEQYMSSISYAEEVENCLLNLLNIQTVVPAQPLQALTYQGAVMVSFTFLYVTEEQYLYQLEVENAES